MPEPSKPEPTHGDIYHKLGSIEAKVDNLLGHDDRIRSLELSRARQRGVIGVISVAISLVSAKLLNLL